MKQLNYFPVFALFLFFGFSSCSPKLTTFTQKLQEENDWSEQDLKRVQFYLSQDVVLRKQKKKSGSKIEDGDIKVISDAEVEEILIKKGTPGVLIEMPKENRFAVCFEDGRSSRYLMFGPNPKRGNSYALLASKWSKKRGELSYGNKKYYTPPSSSYAYLMVNLKKVRKTKVKSRTAGGRKVD
ncbi:MAG: hypothetical protein ACI8YQ_002290 [Polaribacter sp.]|jgi:hypothetical protein